MNELYFICTQVDVYRLGIGNGLFSISCSGQYDSDPRLHTYLLQSV